MKTEAENIALAARLNRVREARAIALLSPLQQQVFQLLAAFFHINDKALPGYINSITPYGIKHFCLKTEHFQAAQQLQLPLMPTADDPLAMIEGVYCMGSTASFGQNSDSDVDVWVVYDPSLTQTELDFLARKCEAIKDWCIQYDLDINCYLVHPQQFTHKLSCQSSYTNMGPEHSGSAQHWLLLEEFYRSHICLGGKPVAWWPDAKPSDTLLYLGNVQELAADEYFGASLWQLYKGLDRPHKALLKVILLEAYAYHYPNTELVTTQIWQMTCAGDLSTNNDAYLLLYRYIESYLISLNDMHRLEIVRRCFYLKCGIALSNKAQPKDWRYHTLNALVSQWNWTDNLLQTLDNCQHWHCGQLQWFNRQLKEQMLASYQTLLKFAATWHIKIDLNVEELGLLMRKLHTYFSGNKQQIFALNTLWSQSLVESDLTVIYGSNDQQYSLYRQAPVRSKLFGETAIYQSKHVAELVFWACLNNISSEQTRWHSLSTSNISANELTQLAKHINQGLPQQLKRVSRGDLSRHWHFEQVTIAVNVSHDPTAAWRGQSMLVDFMNANVLSLGRKQLNMVGSLDIFCLNSWGEWHSVHFDGEEALLQALDFLSPGFMHLTDANFEFQVFSCSQQLNSQLKLTVEHLISQSMKLCRQTNNTATLMLPLQLGDACYGIEFNLLGITYKRLNQLKKGRLQLGLGDVEYLPRPTIGECPLSSVPEVISHYASRGCLQYFLQQKKGSLDVFILNEDNGLTHIVEEQLQAEALVAKVSKEHAFLGLEQQQERFLLPQFYRLVRVKGALQVVPFDLEVAYAEGHF
ncbi:class I adenylate cyclase [Shewanella marina]|uniref:class I adenylate cyclase n=1 Tax=Shewanella marina TaxID=487319 RepID=UPI00046F9FF4|nr:class I adenylate cyclase [Shewanella marina]